LISTASNVKIRQFQHSDAKHIASLIQQTLLEVNSQDYPCQIIQNMIHHYRSKNIIQRSANRLNYVAVRRNHIVGTISLTGNLVSGMFVHSKHHGQGIGTQMLNHIESIALKQKYQRVQLASSITAYEFYLNRGYQPLREVYSEKHGKAIVMEKRL